MPNKFGKNYMVQLCAMLTNLRKQINAKAKTTPPAPPPEKRMKLPPTLNFTDKEDFDMNKPEDQAKNWESFVKEYNAQAVHWNVPNCCKY